MSECCLCGEGNTKRKNGLLRIHPQCLLEFIQTSHSIQGIQDFMKGYRPQHEMDHPTIEAYLKSLQDFAEKCKKLDALQSVPNKKSGDENK